MAAFAIVGIVATAAACETFGIAPAPTVSAAPYPAGCAAFGFSRRRCDAIVAEAKMQEGITDGRIVSTELTTEPQCDPSRPQVVCTYTAPFTANVRFGLADGTVIDRQIRCGIGGEYSIVCTDTPAIRIGGPTTSGYRDVPCTDGTPASCATPLPTLEPAAVASAHPLSVASLDIPIDRVGHHHVEVGTASLPNGVVTDAGFRILPTTALEIDPGIGVQMQVTSTDPAGTAFDNYYAHGWRPGTEDVVVTLDFDVSRFDPGAVLAVRDLVVQ